MNDVPVRQRIREFIERHVRQRNFDDDVDIFALGFVNSMFAMQLVLFVEGDFGIKVEDEDLEIDNFKSVNAIGDLVERKWREA
ncbi:MAG TPA: acyl carrier protein [Pyrinomonadaceae bacterium]|jgi:acyl carrier protein|nr:acyl carrier protein [Pyrinomonadaceae bacterium]